MFLDISWINVLIVQSLSNSQSGLSSGAVGAVSIAKAGRGAKIGSRAIRVLRILRLVRLVRIAKLYKASQKIKITKEQGKISPSRRKSAHLKKLKHNLKGEERLNTNQVNLINSYSNANNEEFNLELELELQQKEEEEKIKESLNEDDLNEEDLDIPEESKVGKKLTDLTTKRTIVLVLSLLLAIILFNPDFYLPTLTAMNLGLKLFNEFQYLNDTDLKLSFDAYVEMFQVNKPFNNRTLLAL